MLILLGPPFAYFQLALQSQQPGGQGCAALEKHAGEPQQAAHQSANTSQGVPEVAEEADDGVHVPLIAEEPDDGNLS
jgi:hypothetical protein